MSASRRVARNTIFRATGEVVAKLASVAFFVVMARTLGSGGFGDFMFALSLATVLVVASGFGFDELVTREVARNRDAAHGYLSDTLLLRTLTCVPLLGLGALVVALGDHGDDVVLAFVLVGGGVAIENISHSWTSLLQAYERQELVALALITQRIATAAAGIAVLVAGGGLLAASTVFLAGSMLGLVTAAVATHRRVLRPRLDIDRRRWWPLVRTAVPIGVNTLLFTVLLKLDQALIGLLAAAGNTEVGIYAAAMRLVEATMFIPWAFLAAMLPWLARQEAGAQALTRGYEVGLKVLAVILLPIGLGFVLLAAPLIDVLYGDEFAGAVLPLRLLGLTTVLYGLNAFAATVMIAQDRPARFAVLLVGVTGLNVLLNIVLVPRQGADGAAIAALASGAVLVVASLSQVRHVVGAIRLVRTFAGPVIASIAMAAIALVAPGPAVVGFVLGAGGFALALFAVERTWSPEDVATGLRLLRRRPVEGAA